MSQSTEETDKVKIGTSGYSYDDWKGVFYPQNLAKSDMLSHYCQHFNVVEINSSYYHIPAMRTIERIESKVPDDFEFIVKTNRETTHRRRENAAAMHQLLEALIPMRSSNKLKGLLAQFPYSFKNNETNRRYLAQTRDLCADIPLFVEFRNDTWNKTALQSFLRDLNISYVNVDEPDLPGLLPAQDWTTSDFGYIRFHGRNKAKWWNGEGSERYDFEYSQDELRGWLTHIARVLRQTVKTYIFFNNHPRGQAVNNGRQMLKLIESQKQLDLLKD